jgi:hypothetical protein
MSAQNSSDNPYLIQSEIYPTDPEQLNIRLSQIYENTSNKVNIREICVYALTEQQTGQQYFDSNNVLSYRGTIRKVLQIPTLATGANTFAHGITFPSPNTYHFTRIYGSINNNSPINLYCPIPNGSIEVTIDLTNVNINIPVTYNGFSGTIVLEWAQT